MNVETIDMMFALIKSAVCSKALTDKERERYANVELGELMSFANKQDVAHLAAWAIKQNSLAAPSAIESTIFKAVYRYESIDYEYERLCAALEGAKICFMPLKGSVIRAYYPEPWMRTSCDIDILVKRSELDDAVSVLSRELGYVEEKRETHDVSLHGAGGVHIELHFDLVEEDRAQNATEILSSVWENAYSKEGYSYWHEMTDEFFYFYHIAHMAKHVEIGGCGVRPFVDLWFLDRLENFDEEKRNALLASGGLLKFAEASRKLSAVWFDDVEADETSRQFQSYLFKGGLYGSAGNRVALGQKKKGGRFGYFISRVFVPYERLVRYYPILKKHRWLLPLMQVRRWFMIFDPEIAAMAKRELSVNGSIDSAKADEMNIFLDNIGLK